MKQELIEKISNQAEKLFVGAKGCHDWDHTIRVLNLCVHIGKKEGADMEILKIAAILHDIGRGYQDDCSGNLCHAEKGGKLARELLIDYEIGEETINNIIHCIEAHRFRGDNIPTSKEAKILFDADKLDAIGAVGIGRSFLFSGEIGAKLHNRDVDIEKTKAYSKEDTAYREYMLKNKKIKNRMLTKEGKRLAQERHKFMVEFFERLNKEVDGDL